MGGDPSFVAVCNNVSFADKMCIQGNKLDLSVKP